MKKQKVQINQLNLKSRFVYVFIAAICCLFFNLTACNILMGKTETPLSEIESLSYQPVPTDMYVISAIEGNAYIKLPPSAQEIHSYTSGIRDIFIMVRFSMHSSELPEFLSSTLCTLPLVQTEVSQAAPMNKFDWWIPDQAQYSEECNGEKEHYHQQIIIDMSNKEIFIIYVMTSTY